MYALLENEKLEGGAVCSSSAERRVQRTRHEKLLLNRAPSPAVDEHARSSMADAEAERGTNGPAALEEPTYRYIDVDVHELCRARPAPFDAPVLQRSPTDALEGMRRECASEVKESGETCAWWIWDVG